MWRIVADFLEHRLEKLEKFSQIFLAKTQRHKVFDNFSVFLDSEH